MLRLPVAQFLSQPFVVGDRVKILGSHGGEDAFVGTVERVDPMRTTLRNDSDLPTVIPNKARPRPLHLRS